MMSQTVSKLNFELILPQLVLEWLGVEWSALDGKRSKSGKGKTDAVVQEILSKSHALPAMPLVAWRAALAGLLWSAKGRSDKTWRLVEQQRGKTTRAEVALQRAVIQGRGNEWWAEVATCSGYNIEGTRRRAVDLVQQVAPGHYRFFELKIASNNPIFAAVELASYALLYTTVRDNPELQERLHVDSREKLLVASRIDFAVVAPRSFYAYKPPETVDQLRVFERNVDEGFRRLGRSMRPGVEMSFEFRAFEDYMDIEDATERLAAGVKSFLDHGSL